MPIANWKEQRDVIIKTIMTELMSKMLKIAMPNNEQTNRTYPNISAASYRNHFESAAKEKHANMFMKFIS